MLITQSTGLYYSAENASGEVDFVQLAWYECSKRIQHLQTRGGREIRLKFLRENPQLKHNEVLFRDETLTIVVDILPCEVLVLTPGNIMEAAAMCYEIGNKHLPLYYEGDELLVPYEAPLYKLLQASGFRVVVAKRRLLTPVKTTVSPHAHPGTESLFSRILKLTNQ